jgi:hypothetical protein
MYVKIGKFKSWWGPYQICDLLKHFGVSDDTCYKLGEKLADTFINDICNWIESKRKRNVKVRIDDYDVWSMDSTLAYIILPMLKKLKRQQHGSPHTDDADVPENLRSANAPKKENDWDTDMWHFERWDWILDEMIWTFEQIHPDSDWEMQYHTGNIDILWKPVKVENGEEMSEMTKGPEDTHVFDKEGWMAHQARISNGLRLFGAYYQGLWD